MCDVKRDLRIPPFCKLPHFLDSSLHWSVKYFKHGRKTFMTRHSVIQRRSDLIILACGLL